MNVVISQSMYFPWVGLLEQIKLADTFVHYDDVQFTKGFYNRVQIKSNGSMPWLTVPLVKHARETNINQILIDESKDWRTNHRNAFFRSYHKAPHFEEMMCVVESVFSKNVCYLSDLSRLSILALAKYFNLDDGCVMVNSVDLNTIGSSTQRLRSICETLGATNYITGHGAKNYLDHDYFEAGGISVEYMKYNKSIYPQLFGPFTPFVSSLDLIANCGKLGVKHICSKTINWKEFLYESK